MPREALASGLGLHIMGAIVDGQVEGVGTGAALLVFVRIDICAARGVFRAVPREALAGRLGLDIVGAVVDGQVEGVGTRAALIVLVGIDICAARSVFRAEIGRAHD